jgi:3-oxoacyl-[acyl-carrier-protein] synthase-3
MRSKIAGIGYYVPETVVTNDDLSKLMDTSDAWIQERTGIKERRHVKKYADETTTILGAKAARIAIERAGIDKSEIDFIVFATLSPDYYFPGCGVLLQRELGLGTIGALDVRNQCSGFLYALSVADQFIKTGMYKNILVVGSEIQSAGLDYSNEGRNVTVIFGDGAGAVVLQPTQDPEQGILTTHLHSDGAYAEKLAYFNPGTHMGVYTKDDSYFDKENPNASVFFTQEMFNQREYFPIMEGQTVFKHAVTRFPEVIGEALQATNLQTTDIDLFIPHQANLRISQFVQARLGLPDEKVFNNIQKYGNTTAASIPIALCEAWEAGKVKKGDLICLAAFGSGFTWASALIRW